VKGSGYEDLDIDTLKAGYEADREQDADAGSFPEFSRWLSVRRSLGEIGDGVFVPTAAALLMYGKSPQTFFPGAFVDVVRYAGDDIDAEIAWRKPVTGPVGEQIRTLLQILEGEIRESLPNGDTSGATFVPDYPKDALEELVRNLVQHRMYEGTNAPSRVELFDGRIEMSNPGGPFGRASEGEFGTHSDYRNPALTAILLEHGYVRQLGRGVRRARALLERNGNPRLEVETDGYTRVIVRARPR
jgi:ATP-dependent DNA helicase RecG